MLLVSRTARKGAGLSTPETGGNKEDDYTAFVYEYGRRREISEEEASCYRVIANYHERTDRTFCEN